MINNNQPAPLEKIVSLASYFTMGLVGVVWIIIAVVLKQNLRPFLKYHIIQSIILSILFFLISSLLMFIFGLISYIPILNTLIAQLAFIFTAALPVINISLLHLLYMLAFVYLIITTLMGKYTYIPWLSKIVSDNV